MLWNTCVCPHFSILCTCICVCGCYVLHLQVDALAVSMLTVVQEEAVDYVCNMSKAESHKLYPALRKKVIDLGYSPKDLEKLVISTITHFLHLLLLHLYM